ncbi:MAG: hypothetical protein F6K19_48370 [Cyanothece sp. SIO1E1]|nr:hypothetical protein [Cyanothece sp. SIO1E1]
MLNRLSPSFNACDRPQFSSMVIATLPLREKHYDEWAFSDRILECDRSSCKLTRSPRQ